jgi:hypothetical protein
MSAYIHNFENLHTVQKVCGVIPTIIGKNLSYKDGILALKKIYSLTGEVPMLRDLSLFSFAPSGGYYSKYFGSFVNALKEAGFDTHREYKTKDGKKYKSSYEYKIALVLTHYNIKFENETPYRKVIANFKRMYRFDFMFWYEDSKYYIEVFGITNNKKYNIRKDDKIKICEKYNIPLISLYPDDIYGKTHNEVLAAIITNIHNRQAT